MPLSNKQKHIINKFKTKKSLKELSALTGSSQDEINNYLNSFKEKKKYPFWFYLIPVLIPVIVFILLELGLRFFDYGENLEQWIDATDSHYMLNDRIAYRYFFSTENAPYPIGDIFEKVKAENAFRVFVLGGSSAAGYPFMPNGSFSKYIRKRLELLYPKNKIEVVNLAFTAVNSYAMLDLLPGVLEQKPDLILIYAGHNEYYGALGAGSMESLGTNRVLVNFIISLHVYKTAQLVRNFIRWFMGMFADNAASSGTLMSRMAKDQYIELDSEVYKRGIEQFKENLNEILIMAAKAGVPVILSELVSNLKDQKPFVSLEKGNHPPAEKIFNEALAELSAGNTPDSLLNKFRYAKDLDALRFRAPEDINKAIHLLALENRAEVIKTDSVFNAVSPWGIAGDNLMTDHLHPTVEGYQIIGSLFFDRMTEKNYLPNGGKNQMPEEEQHDAVINNYHFSPLDETIGRYRIIILKSDWPYVQRRKTLAETLTELSASSYKDTLALKVIDNKIAWEKAHRDLAKYYLNKGSIEDFINEMDVVIDQYPLINEYQKIISQELLSAKRYDEALKYLTKFNNSNPNSFAQKWLGIINLSKNNVDSAILYLEQSIKADYRDAQTLFNLAGAYSLNQNYTKALETVNLCLQVNPDFPGAKNLQLQLQSLTR